MPTPVRPLVPALNYAPELLLQAQGIRVAFFDVDGVLTDGGLYFSESGETLKRFSTLDGQGLKLLQQAGITPVVITGRDSAPLRLRLKALGITHARFGTEDKRPAAEAFLSELGLSWSQAAAMGDDWPDLPVMQRVACSNWTKWMQQSPRPFSPGGWPEGICFYSLARPLTRWLIALTRLLLA